jgi:hypothetical protein
VKVVLPHPFRTGASREPQRSREPRVDGHVLAAFAVLWIVSVARVAGAVIQHQTFGAEATLALMAIGGLPLLFSKMRH